VHQLRSQYVEGIYRPKYYTVTLNSRLRVTQGHWKWKHWMIGQIIHDLLLVELFDVKYYCDLEIWVRGHSRSFSESNYWYNVCTDNKIIYKLLGSYAISSTINK